MHYYKELIDKREYVVGIVGLGYVGLPLANAFLNAGFQVIGFDNDKRKIDCLVSNSGNYIKHINFDNFRKYLNTKFFCYSQYREEYIKKCHALIICVPTPLTKQREPDTSYIEQVCNSIYYYLKPGHLISLESTTYPGTSEDIVKPILERSGLNASEDLFLVYSPEREDPGNKNFDVSSTPKIVGGLTETSRELGTYLYSQIIKQVIPVSSLKTAEMVKILENTYRAVNIALVNELKILCDKMGLDVFEIIRAASTKPFGYHPFWPGPGLGGHCIPIDPFYLTWKAREYDVSTKFIELAGDINTSMPYFVYNKTVEALNERNISIKNSKILLVGVAYKPDIDDIRESPALKMFKLFLDKGASISYYDPYIERFEEHNLKYVSIDFIPLTLSNYDCAVIITNHSNIDYDCLRKHVKVVVDTRGVYKEKFDNVIKA